MALAIDKEQERTSRDLDGQLVAGQRKKTMTRRGTIHLAACAAA